MDELVKQLRNCVDSLCGECKYQQLQKPGNFVPCMNAMITEAADAIEELIEERDAYRKAMTNEHNRAAMLAWEKEHCWIPVTEEHDGEV
jgi:hypothetical protein